MCWRELLEGLIPSRPGTPTPSLIPRPGLPTPNRTGEMQILPNNFSKATVTKMRSQWVNASTSSAFLKARLPTTALEMKSEPSLTFEQIDDKIEDINEDCMQEDENSEPDRDNGDTVSAKDIESILNQDGDINQYVIPSKSKKFRQLKSMRAEK